MREGTIKCICGQTFYYETNRNKINCISCGKEYMFPKSPLAQVAQEILDIPTE